MCTAQLWATCMNLFFARQCSSLDLAKSHDGHTSFLHNMKTIFHYTFLSSRFKVLSTVNTASQTLICNLYKVFPMFQSQRCKFSIHFQWYISSVKSIGQRTFDVKYLEDPISNWSDRPWSKTWPSDVNMLVSWTQYDNILQDHNRSFLNFSFC